MVDKTPSTQIAGEDKAGGLSDSGEDAAEDEAESDAVESETEGSEGWYGI